MKTVQPSLQTTLNTAATSHSNKQQSLNKHHACLAWSKAEQKNQELTGSSATGCWANINL